ncbi:MAG: sulfatase-like hydrolase/transferase [Bacilli bacterium]|nr:sulfatase-like hydrolase/transferase [Bacilli bacterium]
MNKYIKVFILMFIPLLLCEIIFRIVGSVGFDLYSSIRIIIGLIIISLVDSFLLSFLGKKGQTTFVILLNLLVSIYTYLQLGFKSFLGVYISFGTSSQLHAVVDYIKDFLSSFKWTYYLVFIPLVLLVLYYIFIDKKLNIVEEEQTDKKLSKKKQEELKEQQELELKKKNRKSRIIILVILIICFALYHGSITLKFMQNKLQLVSNKELIHNPSNPSIAIKQFGVATYGVLDIKALIFKPEEATASASFTKKEKEITDMSRTIDDTVWQEVIDNENNQFYKNLNNYFINQDITDKNDYTGMFKDKNLIVIMMESVNDIFINKDYYPNFYKLYSKGWHWENNFSPRNSCSTGNNELSGMVSLYSIYNTCTANKYKNNKYFESMFNLFNNEGYTTTSMHNYTEAYYYRRTIHTNMGSGKYYGVQDLGIPYKNEYKNWSSDEDFFNKVIEILNGYDKDEKFMTWLTTVSSHQPYGVDSIQGDMYLDLFKDTDYPKDLQRYMSKLKILDNAIGVLLDGLEAQGRLDDTVIVLYGDHYPYGIKKDVINEVLDYDTNIDNDSERVPFVIYNSKMKKQTFEEYTSYINILPTIANLFDLNYDPRYYVGTDLLSGDYESLVVFADGSWKNEVAYYDSSSGDVKFYTDKTYTTEEIMDITTRVSLKVQMSNLAISTNYFEHLDNMIKEYSQKEDEEVEVEVEVKDNKTTKK